MKLRWRIVATVAAVAGSVMAIKYFVDNQNKTLRFNYMENENNFSEFQPGISGSEFDSKDYLT